MAGKRVGPIDKVVGRNVRIHRLAKRMSQVSLADELGITFQQIQKYESGANRIGSGRLYQIAAVLGVPLMTFFDGTEGSVKASGPNFNELLVEPNTVRMIQAFSNIRSREVRLSLVKLAEGMATTKSRA
jgi:transcriptional regulator with XRE-family HTH domain